MKAAWWAALNLTIRSYCGDKSGEKKARRRHHESDAQTKMYGPSNTGKDNRRE